MVVMAEDLAVLEAGFGEVVSVSIVDVDGNEDVIGLYVADMQSHDVEGGR